MEPSEARVIHENAVAAARPGNGVEQKFELGDMIVAQVLLIEDLRKRVASLEGRGRGVKF